MLKEKYSLIIWILIGLVVVVLLFVSNEGLRDKEREAKDAVQWQQKHEQMRYFNQ